MRSTTYTMLVTIAHEDGAAPSTELLEVIVQRGIEKDSLESGVNKVSVNAELGEHVKRSGGGDRLVNAHLL